MEFKNIPTQHPYVGKYVILRSYDSGVHFGILKSYNEVTRHAYLVNERRLFQMIGFTLSEISLYGMNVNGVPATGAKVAQELPEIMVANVNELIPCSEEAIDNLANYPAFGMKTKEEKEEDEGTSWYLSKNDDYDDSSDDDTTEKEIS